MVGLITDSVRCAAREPGVVQCRWRHWRRSRFASLMVGTISGALAIWLTFLATNRPTGEQGLVARDPICDLGSVRQGVDVEARFELANDAGGPIRIAKVVKSCRCMNISLSSRDLSPGEKTVLKCVWDTSGLRGQSAANLSVSYGEPGAVNERSRHLDLRITGDVVPFFNYSPNQLTFDLKRKSSRAVELHASNGHSEIKFLSATCSHPAFVILSSQPRRVQVAFDPLLWQDGAPLLPELLIETNCPSEPLLRVPLRFNRL